MGGPKDFWRVSNERGKDTDEPPGDIQGKGFGGGGPKREATRWGNFCHLKKQGRMEGGKPRQKKNFAKNRVVGGSEERGERLYTTPMKRLDRQDRLQNEKILFPLVWSRKIDIKPFFFNTPGPKKEGVGGQKTDFGQKKRKMWSNPLGFSCGEGGSWEGGPTKDLSKKKRMGKRERGKPFFSQKPANRHNT